MSAATIATRGAARGIRALPSLPPRFKRWLLIALAVCLVLAAGYRFWLRDSSLVSWRAVAKDGMDLPPDRATTRRAIQQMGNGETYDFEVAPTEPGGLRFTVSSAVGQLLATMPVQVR